MKIVAFKLIAELIVFRIGNNDKLCELSSTNFESRRVEWNIEKSSFGLLKALKFIRINWKVRM